MKKFLLLLLVSILTISVFACGRKGDPKPDYGAYYFNFSEVHASLKFNSLNIHGKITGAAGFLSHVILEVQTIDDEYCEGCPFLVQASQQFDSGDFFVNTSEGLFSINYRPPLNSTKYRFRIIGYHSMIGLPPISTPLYVLEEGMNLR